MASTAMSGLGDKFSTFGQTQKYIPFLKKLDEMDIVQENHKQELIRKLEELDSAHKIKMEKLNNDFKNKQKEMEIENENIKIIEDKNNLDLENKKKEELALKKEEELEEKLKNLKEDEDNFIENK